ncbi:MAG: deoxyribodipyrimidine photo-lyase/cryptochrome family protein [Silvanigrellaceae bacterium]
MQPFLLWWIKRDLRIADNAALAAACRVADELRMPVLALYIFEQESTSAAEYHPRRDRFVLECLQDLAPRLQDLNVTLVVAHGDATRVFATLQVAGLAQVFSHQETGVLWTFTRDLALKEFLSGNNIAWKEFPTNGVVRGLRDRDRWQSNYRNRMATPAVETPACVAHGFASSAFANGDSLMLKATPNLAHEFDLSNTFFAGDRIFTNSPLALASRTWTKTQQRGGEKVAHALLDRFLQPEIHRKYISSLSRPKESQTFSSRLSPYLAFGCITSRQVLAKIASDDVREASHARSLSAFRSRLAWKCHFVQKLENFPDMEEREQNAALAGLRPEMNKEEFERWHHGMTGYPLVDACLRSVHATGFLNFRMRAMLMSFASHLMWRDWRAPSWDLAQAFLDFEPGIHFSQVQMQASVTGNNQIRIYNPIKQSLDNDPDAVFIKQWLPELKNISAANIHALDSLPPSYPKPIVEIDAALARARDTLFKRFKDTDVRSEAKKVQAQLGSRGGFSSWRNKRKAATKPRTRKSGGARQKAETPPESTLFDDPDTE